MADLSYIQSTLETKIVGQDSTGNNANYVSADTNGNMLVKDFADGTTGSAVPVTATQVAGTDGTNLRALSTDSSGVLKINTAVDKSGNGTIAALNGTVVAAINGCSSVVFNVTGTWSATLNVEGTTDGVNWFIVQATNSDQLQLTPITVNSSIVTPSGGYSQVRVRATSYTSGTANIAWVGSLGSNTVGVFNTNFAAFMTTSRIEDGSGNILTSSQQTGTAANKQPLDVHQVSTATSYYSAVLSVRQTAATAANATVFSMRNAAASTKTVYIERIMLMMDFNATTALGRTNQYYILQRFTTATPTGGTASNAGQMDSSDAASQVTDIRFLDTGLTTTSVVFDTKNLGLIGNSTFGSTATTYIREGIAIKLAPGEGLCMRLGVVAVIGQEIQGEILWSER